MKTITLRFYAVKDNNPELYDIYYTLAAARSFTNAGDVTQYTVTEEKVSVDVTLGTSGINFIIDTIQCAPTIATAETMNNLISGMLIYKRLVSLSADVRQSVSIVNEGVIDA